MLEYLLLRALAWPLVKPSNGSFPLLHAAIAWQHAIGRFVPLNIPSLCFPSDPRDPDYRERQIWYRLLLWLMNHIEQTSSCLWFLKPKQHTEAKCFSQHSLCKFCSSLWSRANGSGGTHYGMTNNAAALASGALNAKVCNPVGASHPNLNPIFSYKGSDPSSRSQPQ